MRTVTQLMILMALPLCAEEMVYGKNNLHAFLPTEKQGDITLSFEKVNDTLDIFNIKESEFGDSSVKSENLGDMDGIGFNFGYGFSDKLYLNTNFNQKRLEYSGSTLVNDKFDLYLRYQVYRENNMALAVDGGYTINSAKDTYIYDLNSINRGLKGLSSGNSIQLKEVGDHYKIVYRDKSGLVKSLSLSERPSIGIVNTKDESFYTRLIGSYREKEWLFDSYLGYREIKIKNETDSSLLNEKSSDLQKELSKIDFSQSRTDGMFFGGLGVNYKINEELSTSLNYQYNKMLRVDCLDETDMNHIFNLNTTYKINSDFSLYLDAQLMLNQFNGEIPYLYSNYTQTTFDHKYGFLELGINYIFNR